MIRWISQGTWYAGTELTSASFLLFALEPMPCCLFILDGTESHPSKKSNRSSFPHFHFWLSSRSIYHLDLFMSGHVELGRAFNEYKGQRGLYKSLRDITTLLSFVWCPAISPQDHSGVSWEKLC